MKTDIQVPEGVPRSPGTDSVLPSPGGPDDTVIPSPHQPVNCSAQTSLPPPLPADSAVTPQLDRSLVVLARAARAGDPAARNTLYALLSAKIDRFVRRYRRGSWDNDYSWDVEDLAQEAFLVFADLVDGWAGNDSFTPYFLAHFPWRLRDAVRRLNGTRQRDQIALAAQHDLVSDGTAATEAAVDLLEALTARLSPTSRAMLLWRLRDGERFGTIAGRLGLSRRTLHRHWDVTLDDLRRSLEASSGSTP